MSTGSAHSATRRDSPSGRERYCGSQRLIIFECYILHRVVLRHRAVIATPVCTQYTVLRTTRPYSTLHLGVVRPTRLARRHFGSGGRRTYKGRVFTSVLRTNYRHRFHKSGTPPLFLVDGGVVPLRSGGNSAEQKIVVCKKYESDLQREKTHRFSTLVRPFTRAPLIMTDDHPFICAKSRKCARPARGPCITRLFPEEAWQHVAISAIPSAPNAVALPVPTATCTPYLVTYLQCSVSPHDTCLSARIDVETRHRNCCPSPLLL